MLAFEQMACRWAYVSSHYPVGELSPCPLGANYWRVSTFVQPVLLGATMHEAAQGWDVRTLGDNTAYEKGRVSFNPLWHIGLFGTIIRQALLVVGRASFIFGWAKPVPVYFNKLRHPRGDMVIFAAAGPFTNLVLSVGSGLLLHVTALFSAGAETCLEQTLRKGIFVHVFLPVFNMLSMLPLDGSRIAVGLLPK